MRFSIQSGQVPVAGRSHLDVFNTAWICLVHYIGYTDLKNTWNGWIKKKRVRRFTSTVMGDMHIVHSSINNLSLYELISYEDNQPCYREENLMTSTTSMTSVKPEPSLMRVQQPDTWHSLLYPIHPHTSIPPQRSRYFIPLRYSDWIYVGIYYVYHSCCIHYPSRMVHS
jgi:hypothetical protein